MSADVTRFVSITNLAKVFGILSTFVCFRGGGRFFNEPSSPRAQRRHATELSTARLTLKLHGGWLVLTAQANNP
jgi:hypothetical protein